MPIFAGNMTECWRANEILTECCVSIIENFQYMKQIDNSVVMPYLVSALDPPYISLYL